MDNFEHQLLKALIQEPENLEYCSLITGIESPLTDNSLNTIFKNIKFLYGCEGKIDRRSLMKLCKNSGVNLELFTEINRSTALPVNTREYAEQVYNRHVKRSLSILGYQLTDCLDDDLNDHSIYLKKVRDLIESLEKSGAVTTGVDINEAIQEIHDKAEALKKGDSKLYMKTGILAIDKLIVGVSTKTMSVVAARPSVGKTALGLTFMSNMARAGTACGFISVEMSEAECLERMAQVRSGISIYDFAEQMSDSQEAAFFNSLDAFSGDQNIQLVRTTNRKIENIRSIARKMKTQNPELKVIFIDYLQKIQGDPSQSKRDQVSDVSAILTDMATDFDIHVCALAQLNRDGDDAPKIKHLKESGAIEQDAHMIFLIHRELKQQRAGNFQSDAYIAVAKNRGGRTGDVQIKYNCTTTKFYDEVTEHYPRG